MHLSWIGKINFFHILNVQRLKNEILKPVFEIRITIGDTALYSFTIPYLYFSLSGVYCNFLIIFNSFLRNKMRILAVNRRFEFKNPPFC